MARSDDDGRPLPLRVVEGGASGADGRDEALLRAFLDGDDAAFGELFRLHAPMVQAIVRRYAPGADETRDLVQRAFLRALEAARRDLRRGGRAVPFRPWLIRLSVNLGKNHARDAARWPRAPLAAVRQVEGPDSAAEEALAREERARLLRAAVLRLPRRQREVLTLRLDAELSFAEIAAALRITENNARVHFHHAARRLRELLAGTEGEP